MPNKLCLILAALSVSTAFSSYADVLTDTHGHYLMNAQMHQENVDISPVNDASLGYYYFDGYGTVKHYRLDFRPSPSSVITKISTKHINVDIPDLYNTGIPADLTQHCSYDEMGRMAVPPSTTQVSYGSYSYVNGVLNVDIDGRQQKWKSVADGSFDGQTLYRWDLVNTNAISALNRKLGFGYFSDTPWVNVGTTKAELGQVFNLGNSRSSTTGYYGSAYSNEGAQSAYDFPTYSDEFKFKMLSFQSDGHPDTYSDIWYYDLTDTSSGGDLEEARVQSPGFDESIGLFVQNTFRTNYYSHLPTLIYYNSGHMFHWKTSGSTAYNTRKCWTEEDTQRTGGHAWAHLGAIRNGRVAGMVSVEVTPNRAYPYLSIAHGRWHD